MSEAQGLYLREVNVLKALVFLAGDGGRVAVSQVRLMHAMGWRQRTSLGRIVRTLEDRGLVIVERRGTATNRVPSIYAITPMGALVAGLHEAREGREAA